MTGPSREIQHLDPIWRSRSDFIIGGEILDLDVARSEQLFARQIEDYIFEICCIPFGLYDVSLGDIVETDVDYNLRRVVRESGRYVFRVWFGDSNYPQEPVERNLSALGALIERSSENLIAVDAESLDLAQTVSGYLTQCQEAGQLAFETGRS